MMPLLATPLPSTSPTKLHLTQYQQQQTMAKSSPMLVMAILLTQTMMPMRTMTITALTQSMPLQESASTTQPMMLMTLTQLSPITHNLCSHNHTVPCLPPYASWILIDTSRKSTFYKNNSSNSLTQCDSWLSFLTTLSNWYCQHLTHYPAKLVPLSTTPPSFGIMNQVSKPYLQSYWLWTPPRHPCLHVLPLATSSS